jgi:hypothetical protein
VFAFDAIDVVLRAVMLPATLQYRFITAIGIKTLLLLSLLAVMVTVAMLSASLAVEIALSEQLGDAIPMLIHRITHIFRVMFAVVGLVPLDGLTPQQLRFARKSLIIVTCSTVILMCFGCFVLILYILSLQWSALMKDPDDR